MEAHDYPIAHFESMCRLAQALKALPAQVLDHRYTYECFGSWYVVIRHKGVVSELVFEGRDRFLELRSSTGGKPPHEDDVRETISHGSGIDALDPSLIEKICRAIAR